MDTMKCRGSVCDDPGRCVMAKGCTYRSSAEMLHDVRHKVQDFVGTIDGAGVKGVMTAMKCPLELITPEITEGIAEVLKFGAGKYAPNNWMRGMSWETVTGGILRHVTAFRRGEEKDLESGLPHLHHAACGLMFLSWYANGPQRMQHEKFDDRKYAQ